MTPSSGHLQFQFTHGQPTSPRRADPDEAMRLLVIADFSGRGNRGIQDPLTDRKVQRVDIDRLDQVLAEFGAELQLPLAGAAGGQTGLNFTALEDFHPDELLKTVPSLAELLRVRKDLESSKAADAAEKLRSLLQLALPATPPDTQPSHAEPAPTPVAAPEGESAGDTLARLLGKASPEAPKPPPAAEATGGMDAQAIIKRILSTPGKPTPPPPAGLPGMINAAEMALSERLRSLLSHPDWQALESGWRGLDFLIRRCPDEDKVHYFALDATLAELAADLDGLHRLLRDRAWGGIVANYSFGRTTGDLSALAGLGTVAGALGTSILGGAHSRLVGCDSFGKHADPDDWNHHPAPEVDLAWHELRTGDMAPRIGLALPRFLLRQPYGKAGDAIERFAFEEIIDDSRHDHFAWGNSAFLVAHLLAEGHAAGERIAAGNIGDLQPAHYIEHGGTALKPCAEAWLVDRAAETIARKGLIAVQSFKGRDAAQITGIHAICHPDKPSRLLS